MGNLESDQTQQAGDSLVKKLWHEVELAEADLLTLKNFFAKLGSRAAEAEAYLESKSEDAATSFADLLADLEAKFAPAPFPDAPALPGDASPSSEPPATSPASSSPTPPPAPTPESPSADAPAVEASAPSAAPAPDAPAAAPDEAAPAAPAA